MCVGEAALYGDLVRHLRDTCAREAADRNATPVEAEVARLDERIRTWFFTPQGDDLSGHSPRDYIRAEQLTGRGPVVPLVRLPEWLREEYEEMQRFGVVFAEEDVTIGYAPETTLLDAYDPEGSQALAAALEPCPICEALGLDLDQRADDAAAHDALPVEASSWLAEGVSATGFVPARFATPAQALGFVEHLYRLGAEGVEVDVWHSGDTPDALCVKLPGDRRAAADLYTLWISEMVVTQGLDPFGYASSGELIFAWPRLSAPAVP